MGSGTNWVGTRMITFVLWLFVAAAPAAVLVNFLMAIATLFDETGPSRLRRTVDGSPDRSVRMVWSN